uniref:Epstein-Barr nuclear antigen 6 n=1 Tax=Zeugodacus cucurbitae TaxID=28588 RepID=A0A0A1WZX3_ZEUCU
MYVSMCVSGDTFDHICKDIEEQLIADNNTRYGNVRIALQRALNVGQSLGILTLTNETIRMPFNFRSSTAKNTKILANTANQQVQQPAIGTGNPVVQNDTDKNMVVPSKTHNRVPNNFDGRRGNPDFGIAPPLRSKKIRGRPRGRSCARKSTGPRSYSRGRSGRGRKRARSANGRKIRRR